MSASFAGKVAIVTGAAAGIGRASALGFARSGAKVAAADIDEEEGEKTADLIRSNGGEAFFLRTDVTKKNDVQAFVRKTVETFGRLDYAHNNAGITGSRTLSADYDEDEWDKVVAVNLKGVWLCLKYEIQEMLKSGGGAIVNTCSIAGVVGIKRSAPYVMSKHAVIGLTKTAALEYVRKGIRVNAVCPGMIDTPLLEKAIMGEREESSMIGELFRSTKKSLTYAALKNQQPSGRMGTADEVANAVLWLCSDESSFVTGHAMVIDGAYTAR